MDRRAKIFVAGGRTHIGSALVDQLAQHGYTNLVGTGGAEPELTDAVQVESFFATTRPEYVFVVGGKTAGIKGNQMYPAELIYDNLMTGTHVIHNAYRHGAEKLLYLASSCSYPKLCPQPMKPESLLTGPPEPTNEAHALARLAGIAMCRAYRQQYGVNFVTSVRADPFGPGDHFDLENSHVIPALMRKTHDAKLTGADTVEVWGTGSPRREFILTRDLADGCIFVMRKYNGDETINIGSGTDTSIRELAATLQDVVGFSGKLYFDTTRPDGMPVKILDSSVLTEVGWRPKTTLRDALSETYDWFLTHHSVEHSSPQDDEVAVVSGAR